MWDRNVFGCYEQYTGEHRRPEKQGVAERKVKRGGGGDSVEEVAIEIHGSGIIPLTVGSARGRPNALFSSPALRPFFPDTSLHARPMHDSTPAGSLRTNMRQFNNRITRESIVANSSWSDQKRVLATGIVTT